MEKSNSLKLAPGSSHYKQFKIEPVEYITTNGWGRDFCIGNIVKYVSRYRDKDGVKDLEKAKWYVELLIKLETDLALQEHEH
ncbi:MAG: hypothetical protein AUF65_02405 [Chloroflexi bacterium 13_1_20CM_50_12]|nr:MAG: hypothetical protein AUF65_02405 [Chloroflexi bacterium 13_1_20CM_50_12]